MPTGAMPKGNKHASDNQQQEPAAKRRMPLGKEIEEASKTHKAVKTKQVADDKKDEVEVGLNEKESKKIVQSAMQQLKEEKESVESADTNRMMEVEDGSDDSESDSVDSEEDDNKETYDVELDEETKKLLSAFSNDVQVTDVNTMITNQYNDIKAADKQTEVAASDGAAPAEKTFPPNVKRLCEELGTFLSHYRIGKLPRMFKMLPSFEEWVPLLQMTNPSQWTPQSLFAATKLFIHSSPSEMEKFIRIFLYPIARHSIQVNKKLHFQEYLAVKRCIYRPKVFFKALIFPLCSEKNITLKEATIFTSVIQKVSIPAKLSALAILKLSEMPYNNTQLLFMKTLLDKKYSLPYAVIDGVITFFTAFMTTQLPVNLLWHQTLLIFVQRYANDFKPEQIQQLLKLCQSYKHHTITPLVVVELQKRRD